MITILIPTMNRSDFLIRALNYYHSVGFKGIVSIGDSSDESHESKIKQAIERLGGQLNLIYHHLSGPAYKGVAPVLKALGDFASTPYVAYAGDDDFVIPSTLEKCAAFLENHPDYSAVNGVSITVRLKSGGVYGPITQASHLGAHLLESAKASERWTGYVHQALSTQYYLHRTETWRKLYQHITDIPTRYLNEEFLPCSLTTIMGKVTVLDEAGLGCVFQLNDTKNFGWYTHSMYDLMTQPNWSHSANLVREVIVNALMEQDGLALDQAQAIFDKEFWWHLLFMLQWHYMLHHAEPLNIYDRLKRSGALLAPYLFLKNLRVAPTKSRQISLPALLNPTHPLHTDFMPVYRAISANN